MTAREDRDASGRAAYWAAVRRHPSGFSLDEVNPAWTDCDQLAAWTAHLDAQPEPEMSPLHKVVVWVLLDTAAVLVLLVVGRIVWQGISTVVGL